MNEIKCVLDRILYHISTEIRHKIRLNPDIPIQNNFDDVYFDELDLVIALVNYEIEALVEIPDEFLDYRFSFRQLAEAIALLPKIESDKVEEFREGKFKLLKLIADTLREELRKKQFVC
jgi:hypothetical protein